MTEGEQVSYVITRVVLGIVGLILFFGSFTVVSAGHRGVITNFGKVSGKVFGEGIHLKVPFYDAVHKMNVQTQTANFDNKQGKGDNSEYSSLFAASKDLQDVQIAVVVNYHLKPESVNDIYQKYGTAYTHNVIEPIIRETVKSVSAQYTAEELVTKRIQFSDAVAKALSERLVEKDSVFERFSVVNFEFSKSFSDAIEQKVTAEQNALAAKNKLEQVKYEAEQRISQARGEAEAIRIQAQAITQQGGREYVNLKWVEKWDGKLPTTTVGEGSGLLFNISK